MLKDALDSGEAYYVEQVPKVIYLLSLEGEK